MQTICTNQPSSKNKYKNQFIKFKKINIHSENLLNDTFWIRRFSCETISDWEMLEIFRYRLLPITLHEWNQNIK